jgi:hypothetical protein
LFGVRLGLLVLGKLSEPGVVGLTLIENAFELEGWDESFCFGFGFVHF